MSTEDVRNWIKTPQDSHLVLSFIIYFVCFLAYSPGSWKIVAKWSDRPQLRFAAEFEVKEYGKSILGRTAAIRLL